MKSISATVRLRPVRIALLTRPNDMPAIRKFMRISTCLWGGVYNPIIPVMRSTPSEWRDPHRRTQSPRIVTRGYIEFFEPDAYVEARPGLLQEAGLQGYRQEHAVWPRVTSLNQLLNKQHGRDWAEPSMGQSIVDVLQHVYDEEQRFQLRTADPALSVRPMDGSLLTEALFGVFPRGKAINYVSKSYDSVYKPDHIDANPNSWRRVFKEGALTPLRVTRYQLETPRSWHHDLVIFVFDPKNPLDAIDLWNMRSEPLPIIPVPVEWWDELIADVRAILKSEHRPLRGNPHGVMHQGTVEFARSIGKERVKVLVEQLNATIPKGSVLTKTWRSPIWEKFGDEDRAHRDGRLEVTAEEKRVDLPLAEDKKELSTEFSSISPSFAERHGSSDLRWVNVIRTSTYYAEKVGTVLPFNTFDPNWPRLNYFAEQVLVGTEGWSFALRFKNGTQQVNFLKAEEAVIGSLGRVGIEAKLSEPGHIAKQILDHIGGMWGVHLLQDRETLSLLNSMAGGVRRKGVGEGAVEELFHRRSKSAKEWQDLISKRRSSGGWPRLTVEDFTSRNVIRLGLKTDCTNCHAVNWHNLSSTDYELVCERCQKNYPFPQAGLQRNNGNWAYRVVGPFAVPDYARGSYGALLALNVMARFEFAAPSMSFSPALSLIFDGVQTEVDFAGWWVREGHERSRPPELVIGEAKSFGEGELITIKDIAKLRQIARKLPNAALVISVMRDSFTDNEKRILIPFVNWCRRPNAIGQASNPVILLTGNELFFDMSVSSTWKRLGEPFANFASFDHTRSLRSFADATQAIYLGLPGYHEQRRAEWLRRRKRTA